MQRVRLTEIARPLGCLNILLLCLCCITGCTPTQQYVYEPASEAVLVQSSGGYQADSETTPADPQVGEIYESNTGAPLMSPQDPQAQPVGDSVLTTPSAGVASPEVQLEAPQVENGTDPEPAAAASRISQAQLGIWNDPSFQGQFINSYMAETDIEPQSTIQEKALMQTILGLMAADRIDEAALTLEAEISRNMSCSPLLDFTLANIYFQQDRLDLAILAYQVAVEKFPKFRLAWKNLGMIYVRQGNFEKALPALTRVVELGGNEALTFGLLGFAYSSVENSLSAESAYRMAILLDPASVDWKMGLARSFFKQERFAEAVSILGELIESYPDRVELWLLQANAYIGLNQPLKAAEIYKLIDTLGKSTPESLNMLGDIYINEKLYELAANSYIKAMDQDPEGNVDRPIRAAKILTARGAINEARTLIDHIEKVGGERIETAQRKDLLKVRARIAVADGSSDQEASVLEEIIQIDPLDGEALILLGQHSARAGDTEKAILYYERAEGIEAFEADAKVRHAQLLVQNSNFAEALPLLRRAQQIKPRDNIQEFLEQIERLAKTRQ